MGLLGKLIGIGIDIIETPVAIIKDAATLGSLLSDEGDLYTNRKIKELLKDYDNFKDALKE